MKCFTADAKHGLTIQKPVYTDDAFGGQTKTWQTVATVHAAIYPASGREFFIAQGLRNTTTHKVVIRYRSDMADVKVSGKYRLSVGDAFYGIKTVKNLDADMKSMGSVYQEIGADENGEDIS